MSVFASEPSRQEGYSTSAEVGAGLAIFFFPLISLIVALLLMGGEQNERKRGQLGSPSGGSRSRCCLCSSFLVGWSEGRGGEGGVVTVP